MSVNNAKCKKESIKPSSHESNKRKVKPSQEKGMATQEGAAKVPSKAVVHVAPKQEKPENSLVGDIFTGMLARLGNYLVARDDDDDDESGSEDSSGCDNETCCCHCLCGCTDDEGLDYWISQIASHEGDRVPMDFSFNVSVLYKHCLGTLMCAHGTRLYFVIYTSYFITPNFRQLKFLPFHLKMD